MSLRVLLVGGLVVGAGAVGAPTAAAVGVVYYVDSVAGNDANAGTSSGSAWKSLAKVNGFAFKPGDVVRFKRGSGWTGELRLTRAGTATTPITVDAYGTGNRPKIGGAGNCVTITGSYWNVKAVQASGCAWAGFELQGHHNVLAGVQADNNVAGVSISTEAHHNTIAGSRLVDNNKMSVNDPGGDNDSGAFGVLLNGDDNVITRNTITGSFAPSYDYGYDGAAVEIYDGDRNRIEYNVTADNETFTELGHQPGTTSDDNVFAYNTITSAKPRGAFLVTRGADDGLGPVRPLLPATPAPTSCAPPSAPTRPGVSSASHAW